MSDAKFILSKKKLLEQYNTLKELGLTVSYSYKTNHEIGHILEELTDCDFSIHAKEEIDMINNKSKIWFFTQAESEEELKFRLKVLINKQDYLGYTEARYQMFTYVDNYDGWVDCIYTNDSLRCNSIPNGTVMNCEHVFCQSWFFGNEIGKMKTDLHHLRPSQ